MSAERQPAERKSRSVVIGMLPSRTVSSLTDLLTSSGFTVHIEHPGNEQFERIVRHRPDVIILDGEADLEGALSISRRIGDHLVHRLVVVRPSTMSRLPHSWRSDVDDVLVRPLRAADVLARLAVAEKLLDLENELRQRMNRLEEANKAIARANSQMKQDLYAVAKIQTSLLPSSLPAVSEAEFAWTYKPRMELAGDGLNVFRLDEDHVGFYVLDVSGSGTAAALLSVSLSRQISPFPIQSTLLKSLTDGHPGYRLSPPAEVLCELNTSFPFDADLIQFFTIFYGILNVRTGLLRYSVAGHPLPVLIRPGETPVNLMGGGFPIGFVDKVAYEEQQFEMRRGDRLFVFTDGLSEAHDESGLQFGREGIFKTLQRFEKDDLKKCVTKLVSEAETWCGNRGFHDDVSLLAIGLL
ncbi:MAG TPA: SpoIIE family protein phosphatase [Candidatus Ozemobacteraceae bacterium]|nr:SpoIIE family protein phosphatase [Candidatus Ozemobacteraceae bacterium]